MSQLILQPFRRFTYFTAHSTTPPLLYLRHSSFSKPSLVSPTSQALHLRHLANRPCISTLVTKFSQNIVADTDKYKTLIDCHKCSSSFLSIVKSHPLKIPASVLEKVRSDSCLKLFLIDCSTMLHVFSFPSLLQNVFFFTVVTGGGGMAQAELSGWRTFLL